MVQCLPSIYKAHVPSPIAQKKHKLTHTHRCTCVCVQIQVSWDRSLLYVYVYACFCMFPCAGAHVCEGTLRYPQVPLSLFPRQSISLTWNSLFRVDWLATEPQGSSWLYLPSTGVTRAHHHAWFFCMRSLTRAEVLMPAGQILGSLSHLSIQSQKIFIKVP